MLTVVWVDWGFSVITVFNRTFVNPDGSYWFLGSMAEILSVPTKMSTYNYFKNNPKPNSFPRHTNNHLNLF
jgi:hypothetical protein